MATTKKDNLRLWRKLFITDPAYVKDGSGKPYKYHVVTPYHQVQVATEAWGPCGVGWGYESSYEIVLSPSTSEVLFVATVVLWYRDSECPIGEVARIPATACTKLVQNPRSGDPKVDTDAPKKAITDALTKAFSLTGMAGDVFSGKFDDRSWAKKAGQEHAKRRSARAAPNDNVPPPGGVGDSPSQPDRDLLAAELPDRTMSERIGEGLPEFGSKAETERHVALQAEMAEIMRLKAAVAAIAKGLPGESKAEARRGYAAAADDLGKLTALLAWCREQQQQQGARPNEPSPMAADVHEAANAPSPSGPRNESRPPARGGRGGFRAPVATG